MLKEANGMKKSQECTICIELAAAKIEEKNRTFKTKKIVYMQLAEKHED